MGRSLKTKKQKLGRSCQIKHERKKKVGTVLKKGKQDRPQKINKKINWRRKKYVNML